MKEKNVHSFCRNGHLNKENDPTKVSLLVNQEPQLKSRANSKSHVLWLYYITSIQRCMKHNGTLLLSHCLVILKTKAAFVLVRGRRLWSRLSPDVEFANRSKTWPNAFVCGPNYLQTEVFGTEALL